MKIQLEGRLRDEVSGLVMIFVIFPIPPIWLLLSNLFSLSSFVDKKKFSDKKFFGAKTNLTGHRGHF